MVFWIEMLLFYDHKMELLLQHYGPLTLNVSLSNKHCKKIFEIKK